MKTTIGDRSIEIESGFFTIESPRGKVNGILPTGSTILSRSGDSVVVGNPLRSFRVPIEVGEWLVEQVKLVPVIPMESDSPNRKQNDLDRLMVRNEFSTGFSVLDNYLKMEGK